MNTSKAKDYFFSHIIKSDGCWLWTGYNNGRGYGKFHFGKIPVYAHRFSYQIHKGSIPSGKSILHICDNPPCVNPDHLRLGNQKDNMMDCAAKGRGTHGDKCNLSKITGADVMELRRSYSRLKHEAATRLGLTPANVESILRVRSWKITRS